MSVSAFNFLVDCYPFLFKDTDLVSESTIPAKEKKVFTVVKTKDLTFVGSKSPVLDVF